jgi:hypothetical protein
MTFHTRPILLPDAQSFADVLEYVSEWDPTRPTPPRIIRHGDVPRGRQGYAAQQRGNEIGPYCSVDLSQLGGPRHRGIAVRATDATIAALRPQIVTPDDTLSFKLIGHSDGRVLVVVQHGYIIGSHWLAFIAPETIPEYPYAARDARMAQISEGLREAGHTPFQRNLPDGAVELSSRTLPKEQRAVIHADGRAELHGPEGSLIR